MEKENNDQLRVLIDLVRNLAADEAERILVDFIRDLKEEGLCDLSAQAALDEDECFEFSIQAGMSEGKPQVEIESIIEFARFNQKEIARFQCNIRK